MRAVLTEKLLRSLLAKGPPQAADLGIRFCAASRPASESARSHSLPWRAPAAAGGNRSGCWSA